MTTYVCQECGACCIEAGEVTVTEEDHVPRWRTRSTRNRMGFYSDDWKFGVRRMDKHIGGRCKALEGVVGVPGESCACAIYKRRPKVCREFEPGSPGCDEARAWAEEKMRHPERRPRGYGRDWKVTVE